MLLLETIYDSQESWQLGKQNKQTKNTFVLIGRKSKYQFKNHKSTTNEKVVTKNILPKASKTSVVQNMRVENKKNFRVGRYFEFHHNPC